MNVWRNFLPRADVSAQAPATVRGPDQARSAHGGLAPWQADLVVQLLLKDLGAEVRAAELARLCGLSRSHFAKAFKVTMGAPPHRWVIAARVRRAAELMEVTDERLSAIAASCGFADQSHFTRVFRGATGASPAVWRRWRKART